MNIYPIGTISAASSQGTIDSVTYNMFEPNLRCSSTEKHNILVTRFEQQTLLTRKKAEPMLLITYEYDNILDREFKQIEHFIYSMDDGLTSFFVIDFSKGQTPSAISASGDWTVSIDNTRLYSATTNYKANRAVLWNGRNFKEGQITTVNANTSVVVDVDTNNYGALSLADAQSGAILYPLYQVYASANALSNFKTTIHVPISKINIGSIGGWMRSGSISFVSKYKV